MLACGVCACVHARGRCERDSVASAERGRAISVLPPMAHTSQRMGRARAVSAPRGWRLLPSVEREALLLASYPIPLF